MMNLSTVLLELIAAADVRAISRHAQGFRSSQQLAYLLGALAAILAIWLILSWWDRRRPVEEQPLHSGDALFLDLCRVHRLSASDRQLLRSLAALQELSDPAIVFVRPEVFETSHEPAEAARLAQHLFGDAAEPEASAPGDSSPMVPSGSSNSQHAAPAR